MLLVLPGISSLRVAVPIRLALALTISLALSPLIDVQAVPVLEAPKASLSPIAAELTFGLFLGLLVRFHFLAFEFMVTGVAMSVGLSGVMGVAVEGQEAPTAFGNLMSFAALTVLFTLDFHHLAFRGLVQSYDLLPSGQFPDREALMTNLVASLAGSFRIALQLASPFIAYAVIANVILGFLNKLAMQIPVYFIALPFILFGFLVLLYFVMPHVLFLFGTSMQQVFDVRG